LVLCLGGLSPPKPLVATRLEGVCYHENMKTFIKSKKPAVKIGDYVGDGCDANYELWSILNRKYRNAIIRSPKT